MPPKLRGTIKKVNGIHYVRVRTANGKRPWLAMPPGLSEAQATARGKRMAEDAKTMDYEPKAQRRGLRALRSGAETTAQYILRWLRDRRDRKVQSVDDDMYRLNKYVPAAMMALPIESVNSDDIEAIRDDLDARIVSDEISAKNAQNIWGIIKKLFSDTAASKNRVLRVRKDNPAISVRAPERAPRPSKQYLYPSEFLQLVTCDKVPVHWRRIYALSVYLYTRVGELVALRCEDMDLVHGFAHVSKARQTDLTIGQTKTCLTRRVGIESELRPLLEKMIADVKSGPIVTLTRKSNLGELLRGHLWRAGVRRSELHDERDASRVPITFHDLRATGITWLAVRGDDPLRIKSRAGHRWFSTTERYIREAEQLRDGFGDVFPILPVCIL